MQFILCISPSLCLQGNRAPLRQRVMWGHGCRRTHRYDMYNHNTHRSSQLTQQNLPVSFSDNTIRKKKEANIVRRVWRIKIRKQFERKNTGVLTICGRNIDIFFMKQSQNWGISAGRRPCCLGITTSPSCWILSVNTMIKTELLFYFQLFWFLCFLFELFTEWEQRVEVYWFLQDGFLALDCYLLLYLAGCRRYSGVGVLERALSLGNNTTTHTSEKLLHTCGLP